MGFAIATTVIVRLDRRELVRIAVTSSPTAEWIARQITEAFPWDSAPGYLIRDRDRAFGPVVRHRLRAMGIRDKPIAPHSPWQNGFAERLIGSVRRECLDHTIVFGEAHLRRLLISYGSYYNEIRTHRALQKNAPIHRPIERIGIPKSRPIFRYTQGRLRRSRTLPRFFRCNTISCCRSVAISASRAFNLNGETKMARTNQRSPITRSAYAIRSPSQGM